MENNQPSWQSKSGGIKRIVITLPCLIFLIAGLIVTYIGASSKSTGVMIAGIAIVVIGMLATLAVMIVGKRTDIKWEVKSLIFFTNDSGVYFTAGNGNSYFEALWSEVKGYSAVENATKGTATVTVYLNKVENAGMMGNIDHIKMVNVTGYSQLKEVFASKEIAEVPAPTKK